MYALAATLLVGAVAEMGVYGYVPRADSTPTESAPPAIVTPIFSFNNIPEMTTCNPATITWIYDSFTDLNVMDLTLNITNDLPEIPGLSTTATWSSTPDTNSNLVNQSLTSGFIDPTAQTYTWASVNVTEGWYAIVATFASRAGTSEESVAFYIVNGTDTSCLGTLGTSQGASPSSGSPTSSVGFPSSSPATHPSDAVSSKLNREALVGGVIGGIALLVAVIAAYCCFSYPCASSLPSRRRGTRKWSSLGSAASKRRTFLNNSRVVSGHGSDSFGHILADDGYVLDIGRTSEEEDKEKAESISSFFPTEDLSSQIHGSPMQSPFSDSRHSDVDDLSPLSSFPSSHPNSQYSAASTSLTTESHFSHNLQTTIAYPESSYPPTPLPAFPSGTSLEMGENQSASRGSAGEHTAIGARRLPRKPVPQYNPADSVLTPPSPAVAPPGPGSPYSNWLTVSQKTGFDALPKPMHYLIPDMPPSAN